MTRAAWARLLLLAALWGASFLLIKLALGGLSPIQVVLVRLTAGAGALAVILAARRERLPRRGAWPHLLLMGVVANIVPFFAFAYAEQHITSGLAGVLNAATPLFTMAFAIGALPEERLTAARGTGIAIGFTGVVLLVGPWNANPLTSSVPGQLACLLAAALYGVAFVYTRRFLAGRGDPPLSLATAQLGCATAVLWLLAPLAARTPVDLTPVVVGSAVTLGVVMTGLAYLLYYGLIERAGATSASMVTYFIPVVAVALGVLVLDEPVTWNLFAGAAVVLLGVMLAEGRLDRWSPLPPARPTVDAPAVPAGDRG